MTGFFTGTSISFPWICDRRGESRRQGCIKRHAIVPASARLNAKRRRLKKFRCVTWKRSVLSERANVASPGLAVVVFPLFAL